MVCGHGIAHGPEMEARLKFLTFGGREVALLSEAPDWKDSFDAEFSLLATQEQSLSGRESRRAMSVELRTKMGFSVTVADAEARGLSSGLKQYQNQLLGVPFWPGLAQWSDRAARKISGGVNLVYKEDWSQWELYFDGAEPVWPAIDDVVVPVLFGRMEQRRLRWPSPSAAVRSTDATSWPQRCQSERFLRRHRANDECATGLPNFAKGGSIVASTSFEFCTVVPSSVELMCTSLS